MNQEENKEIEVEEEVKATESETESIVTESEPETEAADVTEDVDVKREDEDTPKADEPKAKSAEKPLQKESDDDLEELKEFLRAQKKKESLNDGERKFTQAEFDKALTRALAKKLPSKEEMEQFKHWKENQQTEAEKLEALQAKYLEAQQKSLELEHENAVIKAGVSNDAVDFVLFKVERMEGDFKENLEDYLSDHKKYITPKTTVVEGAEHKVKPKAGITRDELDKMGYAERAEYKRQHPDEYRKAMTR